MNGGGIKGNAVAFRADGITLSGFTIIEGGDWANDGGIHIMDAWDHHSSHNTIPGNIICHDNTYAIDVYQSSYNTITDNIR